MVCNCYWWQKWSSALTQTQGLPIRAVVIGLTPTQGPPIRAVFIGRPLPRDPRSELYLFYYPLSSANHGIWWFKHILSISQEAKTCTKDLIKTSMIQYYRQHRNIKCITSTLLFIYFLLHRRALHADVMCVLIRMYLWN